MQVPLSLLGAVAALGAALVAPIAAAQDPLRVAQAQEGAPEPEAAEPKPPSRPGIEEIVVRAGESEAVGDAEAADSVTGFDASDLAALGVQTIEGLSKFTPNLEIVTAGATTPTFFIRGVGLNDFNPNSSGSVAIYRDDVSINAPALQLGALFDMERVNILRGPQGTGLNRNASAGAIKLYSRRPSGEYGAFLRSDFGNYNYRDFEGAIEAPLYEDILSSRLAFRFAERDGYAKNGCGGAPPRDPAYRPVRTVILGYINDPQWSICGERVIRQGATIPGKPVSDGMSPIPEGLPTRVNNLGNWAARGTLLFQPTLDMEWLLGAHGSRRDELSRLGQAYGTNANNPDPEVGKGLLGGPDAQDYIPWDVKCPRTYLLPPPRFVDCGAPWNQIYDALIQAGYTAGDAAREADGQVAEMLANDLDPEPHRGDYDRVGPTTNDTWGLFLKGDIALPKGMELKTVTGYETYDRLIDIDLDMSPNELFEIRTDDEGWQLTQDLSLAGQLSEALPLRWEVGGFYLMEELHVVVHNDLGLKGAFSVSDRDYTQRLWDAAGYGSLEWDLGRNFTLDGGFRFNWERKSMDYSLVLAQTTFSSSPYEVWSAPTGTVRLTYRFREDTHAFWKYTRGWKGGHFNATASGIERITVAEPETIDAFETGLRGSWFEGRLGLDLSLFYYGYTNYQIFTTQQFSRSNPEFVVLNANDAEVYGAELDLVARPFWGAYLNLRFSWLESQFLDFVQIQRVQISEALTYTVVERQIQSSGNPLLNSPRFKLSLTAEQTLPLGRFGSLTLRYDGAWSDVTYYDASKGRGIPNIDGNQFLPENTIAQRAFMLHNVRLGYRPPRGNLEISAWVRNLTDEVYKTFAFDGSTFNQTTVYFVGEPRTYGLSFVVNF